MSEIDEKEIKRRFEAISRLELSREVTARNLEQVRKMLARQASSQRTSEQKMWRIIMKGRITKFAVAAAIILLFSLFSVDFLKTHRHTETDTSPDYILCNSLCMSTKMSTSPRYILFEAQNNYLKETLPCNILPPYQK